VCDMRGHIRKIRKSSVSIKNDDRASVEGMPLYMLIMVVVVVAAIGIITGLMGAFTGQNLGEVSATPDVIHVSGGEGSTEFTVTVKDTEGRAIEGATVYIEGEGVATAAKTGEDGTAAFSVSVDLGTKAVGELSIRVSHDGAFGDQTKSTSVLLVSD
jgi:hypothetical protein